MNTRAKLERVATSSFPLHFETDAYNDELILIVAFVKQPFSMVTMG